MWNHLEYQILVIPVHQEQACSITCKNIRPFSASGGHTISHPHRKEIPDFFAFESCWILISLPKDGEWRAAERPGTPLRFRGFLKPVAYRYTCSGLSGCCSRQAGRQSQSRETVTLKSLLPTKGIGYIFCSLFQNTSVQSVSRVAKFSKWKYRTQSWMWVSDKYQIFPGRSMSQILCVLSANPNGELSFWSEF